MREIDWGATRLTGEDSRPLTCRCTVLARTCPPPVSAESYGVRLTLEETGEAAEVQGLTLLPGKIETLADTLLRCGVTPCALADVVSDWLL